MGLRIQTTISFKLIVILLYFPRKLNTLSIKYQSDPKWSKFYEFEQKYALNFVEALLMTHALNFASPGSPCCWYSLYGAPRYPFGTGGWGAFSWGGGGMCSLPPLLSDPHLPLMHIFMSSTTSLALMRRHCEGREEVKAAFTLSIFCCITSTKTSSRAKSTAFLS